MRVRAAISALCLIGAAAFAGGPEDRRLRDLSVPFYYDLGPDTIDLREYPKKRRAQYRIFARRCSACHTLARAINTPMRGKQEWEYYVYRMRLYGDADTLRGAQRAEWDDVVDFLVYDSRIRKIRHGERFEEDDRRLRAKFAELHRQRLELLRRAYDSGPPDQGR